MLPRIRNDVGVHGAGLSVGGLVDCSLVSATTGSWSFRGGVPKLELGDQAKAEALRRTQLALLRGELGATDAGAEKGKALRLRLRQPDSCPSFEGDPDRPWGHPYYWAPFILMGNWL